MTSPGQGNIPDCSGSVESEVLEPCLSTGPVASLKTEATKALASSKSEPPLKSCGLFQNLGGNPDKNLSNPSGVCDEDINIKGNSVVREKATVFSQWTGMLDFLEVCLKDSSIGYRRLDGKMSIVARDKAVKDFNTLPEVCGECLLPFAEITSHHLLVLSKIVCFCR